MGDRPRVAPLRHTRRAAPGGEPLLRIAGWLAVLGVGAAFAAMGGLRTPPTLVGRAAFDVAHGPWFGLVALVVLGLLRALPRPSPRSGLPAYGAAFALTVGLGVLDEWRQVFTQRTPDPGDLLRDALGAASFLLLAASLDRELRRRLARSAGRRALLRLAAFALFLPVLLPAVDAARAYARRNAAFPALLGFDAPWEEAFVRTLDAELARVPPPPGWRAQASGRVGRVTFLAERHPQLVVTEPVPDWSGYRELRFTVHSPLERPATLRLRVVDETLETWRDRSDHELRIEPGPNRIAVPLAAIREGPQDRELDLTGIRRLSLHPVEPEPPFAIHLDDLRLE